MSDARHRRKKPTPTHFGNGRRSVSCGQYDDSRRNLVASSSTDQLGGPDRKVYFNRSEARKLRDWLNHFLEYAAQQ